jgi:hypothetical protein
MKIKGTKKIQKQNDCGCGKPVKVTERKKYTVNKPTKK